MENLIALDRCLACDNKHLELALDLGHQPLANSYQTEVDENESFWPLAVNRCTKCNHLQLTHIVAPELIYKNYAYVSGTSQTYVDYMKWYAKWTREYADQWLGAVLDIGCNDGSQLDAYQKLGFITYGVDPAENLHATSTDKGHKVVCGFWDKHSIKKLKHDSFDIVTCQNAFAHNPDPVKFLELLEPLVKKNGMVFVQTSQADMVRNNEFDTIYHEHISFYNINSFNEMVKRTPFYLIDVVKTPIHGNSYVFVLSKNKKRPKHIDNLIAMEEDLLKEQTYKDWANKANKISSEFRSRIQLFRDKGYKLIGYGAAAKGNTLLNFANVTLDYIVDDNPLKQGKFSPGKDIPIVSSAILDTFTAEDKILFVPLAWNFFEEIRARIKNKRNNSDDRFLKYFPEVEIGV
jgi:SAM-dependent methyltransferase